MTARQIRKTENLNERISEQENAKKKKNTKKENELQRTAETPRNAGKQLLRNLMKENGGTTKEERRNQGRRA